MVEPIGDAESGAGGAPGGRLRASLLQGLAAALFLAALLYFGAALFAPGFGERGLGLVELPRRRVQLTSPPVSDAPRSHRAPPRSAVLRLAVAPVISPERSLGLYEGLARYLGRATGRRGVLVERGSYAEVNDLVRYGYCDAAFVCSYAFVRGEREFGMQLLAIPRVGGSSTYHSLIVVPAGSKARSLLDLRHTRFASADLMSTSGWLYPARWLQEHGEDPSSFFRRHTITGSHDRSLVAVASGYVDGAAVDSLVFAQVCREDPGVAAGVRVVDRSPPYGMPPFVASPLTDSRLVKRIRAVLLDLHTKPEGRALLRALGIDRFDPPDPSLYDDLRRDVRAWEGRP